MEKNKILIIEDDDLMQGMLVDTLKSNKYHVVIEADGEAGLRRFQEENFDLILLDMKLPKIDGLTLLKKVKEYSQDHMVIMMTAYGTIETAVEAMKIGAYDYITKPFLAEELQFLIEKALEHRCLKSENLLLKQELDQRYSLRNIIGKSAVMRDVYRLIEIVAPRDSNVLIQGESGTGKELVAEALHHLSERKGKPLIKVSCAALPQTLLESELFGHEKGAFTDATRRKIGRIEMAHKGTLFLDDVDDIETHLQVKLLRFLQEKEFERVGGTETIKVDIRIISASKKDLKKASMDGEFREDLFYRLNVVPIVLPPLRERRLDIPLLVNHFLDKFNQVMKKTMRLHPEALKRLTQYHWPGNIRELENLIERLMTVSVKDTITLEDLPEDIKPKGKWEPVPLKKVTREAEKEHIQKVLQMTHGRRKDAADILGITPKTLWQKSKEYGI